MKQLKNLIKYYSRHNILFEKKKGIIDSYHNLTNDSLERLKNEKFLNLFKMTMRKSPFYNKFYSKQGVSINDINSLEDICKLPILTKSHVRDNYKNIWIGLPYLKFKGYTSGTSGTPLTVFRDYSSILLENAYVWSYRNFMGLKTNDRKVIIRGQVIKNNLFFFDKISNTLYLSSYSLNEINIQTIVDMLRQFEPMALIGYPSSLYTLALLVKELGFNFNIPMGFTSSETLYDYQRSVIEGVFSISIYDWYGNSERTIALQQNINGQYVEAPLYSINEYHEDKIITTSLINQSFPLIRYQVEDKVILSRCAKSKGILIDKIQGRSDDQITLIDGTVIGSPGLSTSFKEIKGVLHTQIIQESYEYLNVLLVVNDFFDKLQLEYFKRNLKERVGENIEIRFKFVKVDELIRSRNGKFKLVINNIR